MKVQFNLLPDVKQRYVQAEKTKKTVMTTAVIVSAVSLLMFLIMAATVYLINKKQLSDANKDITRFSNQLKNIPNLGKILTVQDQLQALPKLHQSKHVSSRIFTYLPQVTPTDVNLGSLSLDFATNTILIEGTAASQKSINTFVDTLKFTTYKQGGQDTKKPAFPSVIESSFGLSGKNASYSLTITFDPVLFSNSGGVELLVPAGLSTTRSVLDDPMNVLFNGQTGGG